ncbi:MAG: SulP family inorganic anion transporter [Bacteroidetes bacterium]|nr:SulP family inorganic anion transporter [Bacteroidota bacterium]MDA1120576.1 SulP family inorganic anion transporter [Bacteroidota bacterium]
MHRYFPFIEWWPKVNSKSLKSDFLAGMTNAVIVLPQGVAFAIIAGLPPVYGLYTAIVTPVIAAFFGSSWHLISGPTMAISIVIYSSLSPLATPSTSEFIELALLMTFMAGVIQWVLGISRLGTLVNFVSHSVVVGFTSGAAILIGFSQMRHVLGISAGESSQILDGVIHLIKNIQNSHILSVSIALVTGLTALVARRISKLLPHLLIGMLAGSFLSYFMRGSEPGVALVGIIPNDLPPFSIPAFSFVNMRLLAPKAFAMAMLGLIIAIANGKSIALKSGQVINGNQEFIGQGLSNIVGSFFSCFMGTGSFGRSGINYESGAKTPMSALFAALSLMLILLLIAPLTAYLPMPALGGVILLVAYKLIDFKQAIKIFKASWQESSILIITFFSTLLLPLEYAIYFGVLLSLIFYLQRTSHPLIVTVAPDPNHAMRKFTNIKRIKLDECPQLKIIRIDGSLFYGAIDHTLNYLRSLSNSGSRNVLIVSSGINIIDVAGAEMLVNESRRWREMGGHFYLSSIRIGAREFLVKGGYYDDIGSENIFETKDQAIQEIFKRLDSEICQNCSVKIFKECKA